MPNDVGKLRVLIPTTNGPVEVLLLTEEDAVIGRCVACIGGTTETADIAAAYHAFVVRPTGVIESRFGHSCYRLDVSGRIDAGSSWQLGVLAAHALHAAGRLAQENDAADGVLWATGSVRPVDLTVGGVSHVPEKLASSIERLKQEAVTGRHVLLALPTQNAADISPPLKAELTSVGIEVIELAHVDPLFDRLGMKLPDGPQKFAATSRNSAVAPAPRRRYLWGVAATALLGIAVVTAVLLDRLPATTINPAPAPAEPAASEQSLVPELVPFISARDQAGIRDEYLGAPNYKALATSLRFMGFVSGQPDQKTANDAAIEICRKRVNVFRAANNLPAIPACELYASGNIVVSRRLHPPMPPTPWVVRNPAVERPFVAADLPLVTEEYRVGAAKNYPTLARSKAYIVAPNGFRAVTFGEPSPEEAMRRALERCGSEASGACMVVAIDDTFVVAVPTMAKVVGFYRPDALTAVQPSVRDDIARRLANTTNGWNAVAIGISGRAGIKVGAGSEQTAFEGALEDCAKHDRDCQIAVIGPFLVEPDRDRRSARTVPP